MDMYGHAIGVTYRGRDSYKTCLGALVTLATFILMTINAVSLFIAFQDGSKQEVQVQSTKFDRTVSGEINLVDQDFEISFLTFPVTNIDPEIGRIYAVSVHYENENEILSELTIGNCSDDKIARLNEYWEPRSRDMWNYFRDGL